MGVRARALAALVFWGCTPTPEPPPPTPPLVQETTAMATAPSDPFEGVFPPAWKVGDRWRVNMRTNVPLKTVPLDGKPIYQDAVFEFRVDDAPTGDEGVYILDISSKTAHGGRPVRWVGKYRKKPFSFVRIEDEQGEVVPDFEKDNTAAPHIRAFGGFVSDFPAMPLVPGLGYTPFLSNGKTITQHIERTPDGLRFTLFERSLRVVMEWKHGAPWWSSVERSSPLADYEMDSARLLPGK